MGVKPMHSNFRQRPGTMYPRKKPNTLSLHTQLVVGYGVLSLMAGVVMYFCLRSLFPAEIHLFFELVLCFVVINIISHLVFGFDKMIASSTRSTGIPRVPELLFFLYGVAGGALGILLGRRIFRHKTLKSSSHFVNMMMVALVINVGVIVILLIEQLLACTA